ncbi:CDP-diacylglycerol--glycerol-3-phosphate 3-phosphatidyltransferase [Kaistia terrae]|jgi:cardiolipin synthase|uniref:CDP-diacylglycerol--glycerol-3-phosphate 3-phosphatidyltransferase n=1 Tax=Kaistia terrae TaxID=537017 RepID=A0ABW0PUH7_9HYPH|nr:CDP-diacylglycerol--glycerol-3-phosphate 3-phosphatidyltransferase [Kaistia terrae]MCX5576994.1 CDP-diacylglycerol--glycerol-3-phosphate 3-phosphatidyltransferase [Kaistia terrae]
MSELRTFDVRRPQRALLLSLPNILTYARILAVPLVVFCVVGGKDSWRWIALSLFIIASVTDYLDGYLARIWKQQSSLGRMLDPIADKLLVSACLLALVFERTIGGLSLWAALIILSREILVSGLREYLAELRVSVPVSRLAKWKTALQMVSIAFLLAGPAGDAYFAYATTIGIVLLWISAIVTLYTGYDYFRAGLSHILEEET